MLIFGRHVFANRCSPAFEKAAAMSGNDLTFAEDFNYINIKNGFYFYSCTLEWDTVAVSIYKNMMILAYNELDKPLPVTIARSWQWLKHRFINF